jgi:hypothetical protein
MRNKKGRFTRGHKGYWKGRKFTDSHKESISKALDGHIVSDETKVKIGSSNKISQIGNRNNFKGGRTIDGDGYVKVYMPKHPNSNNCYVLEHRLIMEKVLGRSLSRKEVVHHINGNKKDNRPENLVVFDNQSDHKKFEKLVNAACFEFTVEANPKWMQSKESLFRHLNLINPEDRE